MKVFEIYVLIAFTGGDGFITNGMYYKYRLYFIHYITFCKMGQTLEDREHITYGFGQLIPLQQIYGMIRRAERNLPR